MLLVSKPSWLDEYGGPGFAMPEIAGRYISIFRNKKKLHGRSGARIRNYEIIRKYENR